MKKYMVADFIKENNQDIADRWNITLDELECMREISTNEADFDDIMATAESLGLGLCDVSEEDVWNYVDMGRENKGELKSSIGPIQWIYDHTLKAYLILAYLVFELDKDPKPVMYKLSPKMMRDWASAGSFGDYWNENIRKNSEIEDDEHSCGCNPNPCDPQKVDRFNTRFVSIS